MLKNSKILMRQNKQRKNMVMLISYVVLMKLKKILTKLLSTNITLIKNKYS